MLILAINTALAACDLAVLREGAVLSERQETMARGQDGRLPILTQNVLEEAGVSLAELDRIAIVTGPGSFTGIRIGVAFARGLALALDIPAIGMTSLEAGLPPTITSPARAVMAAQKRPPDRTWWTQELQHGLGVTDIIEVAEDSFEMGEVEIAAPRALWAGIKAVPLSPNAFKPVPAYARAPEIHKPRTKP